MERKIGEIFEHNGEWYQCVNQNGCCNCAFYNTSCHLIDELSCNSLNKKRKEKYIFKKLEKVGKPYEHYGKLYQCYKLPVKIEIGLLPDNCYPVGKDNLVEIELKQTKDMGERDDIHPYDEYFSQGTVSNTKNLAKSNLKPFDLEAAKQGKPVCTRDGRKARIICFDVKAKKPIAALITNDDTEEAHFYYDNGRSDQYQEYRYDLMMLPEKKEGWVNVYKRENEYICENECNVFTGITVYKSEGEAKRNIDKNKIYVNTIKIHWEE